MIFGEKRVGKMLKLCRKYLNWIQNSVFEGEISEVKLKELTIKAKAIMDTEEDSIIIFSNHTGYYMNKQVVGKRTDEIGQFLVATLYRNEDSGTSDYGRKRANYRNRKMSMSVFYLFWQSLESPNSFFDML
jgi:CRISPR-associated protein Cas2